MSGKKHIIIIPLQLHPGGPATTRGLNAEAIARVLEVLKSEAAKAGITVRECGEIGEDQWEDLERVQQQIKPIADRLMAPAPRTLPSHAIDEQKATVAAGVRSTTFVHTWMSPDGTLHCEEFSQTTKGLLVEAHSKSLAKVLKEMQEWYVELGVKIVAGIVKIVTRKQRPMVQIPPTGRVPRKARSD